MQKKIKLLKIPSEYGAGTRGASLGIEALRMASIMRKSDLFSKLDTSTISVPKKNLLKRPKNKVAKYSGVISKLYLKIAASVAQIISNSPFLFVLSGDHSCAGGVMAGLAKAFPNKTMGVIWIDAHADIHSPYTTPSGNIHGMPVATALGFSHKEIKVNEVNHKVETDWQTMCYASGRKGILKPEHLVYIAIRDTEPEEDNVIDAYKIKKYDTQMIRRVTIENVVKQTIEYLSPCDYWYVSFDVDSLDDTISRGTGTPAANGLLIEEARYLLKKLLAHPKTICLEIAEINPLLDNKNRMAEVAFELLEDCYKVVKKRIFGASLPQ
ncbi:MAG: arginase [Bacteroidia bacterium]|nr:arginase [Bacteroidia bacterium]MDW8302170.1 arginase [Bacteroidia bacterium]